LERPLDEALPHQLDEEVDITCAVPVQSVMWCRLWIRSTSILAQLHATLSGSGLCMLSAFVASGYSTLVPLLPDQVSFTPT
jgi:hypothetical protein